ncbi:hypothetical protein SAMN05421543_101503 [Alicyclobacillus macrosporangiidus]|jgi:hypothetical protein|uniref:Uncharacterized protein n=1 Tax=Alicyclobacillus macrosporangiidus TaxID=392015 RepID=A0A1I7FXK8_9BACL|nr:hypothetical protein SAMN05421543_101503 [Alicyclobacillus macrosporangiidus]
MLEVGPLTKNGADIGKPENPHRYWIPLAERVGFEPTVPLRTRRFSRSLKVVRTMHSDID